MCGMVNYSMYCTYKSYITVQIEKDRILFSREVIVFLSLSYGFGIAFREQDTVYYLLVSSTIFY